ncbi:MAG: hypothetical protein WBA54_13560 [Acidaminobacteraceae bacterium]
MAKSIWKSGDSRSLRLTDKISFKAYELLNSDGTIIKRSRNDFITSAINSQTIIEQGTLEDKLRLLGITDFMKSLSIETITKLRELDVETTPGDSAINNEGVSRETKAYLNLDIDDKEHNELDYKSSVIEVSKMNEEVATSHDKDDKPTKNAVLEDIIGILSGIPDKN